MFLNSNIPFGKNPVVEYFEKWGRTYHCRRRVDIRQSQFEEHLRCWGLKTPDRQDLRGEDFFVGPALLLFS